MNWIALLLAGLFEIGWTVGLKNMDNHRHLLWSVVFYMSIITSFWFLQSALKTIPLGTAYAIYTGIGAVGTALVGILFFGESYTVLRLGFLALMVVALVGLKLTTH